MEEKGRSAAGADLLLEDEKALKDETGRECEI